MKLKKLVLSLFMMTMLILSTSLAFASPQKYEQVFLNRVNSSRAMEHIEVLSEDIGPRIAGSNEEYQGALYIAKEFEKMNFDVEIQEFVYTSGGEEKTSWNVVATKGPSAKGNSTDEIVHVTAHYDSVRLAPGANDNASGVASMLEIAKSIGNIDIDREVRFIACGAEEVGLRGSRYYVDNLTQDEVDRSIGCFNLDMVATAYDPCSELAVYTYDGKENAVTDAMKKAGESLAHLSTETVEYNGDFDGKMGSSDHVPFTQAGIDAALFINVDPEKKDDPRSAIEPYYHKPEDHTGNISEERLERTIKLAGLAILNTLKVD